MMRRLLVLLPALVMIHCASPYQLIDGYRPEPGALGGDSAANPPAGWPEGCHAVNMGYALSAECGGRMLYVMRFGYEPDDQGYRKAFAKMFSGMEMGKSRWQGPASAHVFQREDKESAGDSSQYNLGFFLKEGKGIMAFHCTSMFPADSSFCGPALIRLAARGWGELHPIRSDTSSFDFAGRTVTAGPLCRFMAGRNYQCPGSGQLNWSEFDNARDAETSLRRQMETTLGNGKVRVAVSDTVECALEEQATVCVVNTYKFTSLDPRVLVLPRLVAMYAKAEVRGRHIGAVCSFYEDDAPALCDDVLDPEGGLSRWIRTR